MSDFYAKLADNEADFFELLNAKWDERLRGDARDTAIPAIGLSEEAAEVREAANELLAHAAAAGGPFKKFIRDGKHPAASGDLLLELGDVFHYWCRLVHLAGFTPMQVAHANQGKLAKRTAEKRAAEALKRLSELSKELP